MESNKLGFGGGCFWCTEAVFKSLKGVKTVMQGWIASNEPNDSFSEAVLVEYDTELISVEEMVRVHLRTHSSSVDHSMRKKYRSAIYFTNDQDEKKVAQAIFSFSNELGRQFVTKILPLEKFRENDEVFWDYYRKNPDNPFCQTYIEPKLDLLKSDFQDLIKVD